MAGILDAWQGLRAQSPGMGAGMEMNPLQRLLQPEIALPMAAALMGNQGNATNFGNAFGTLGQSLQAQKQQQAELARQNQTLEFLRRSAPDLAQLAEQGGMPMDQVWRLYTEQRTAQKGPNPTDDMREYDIARQQGFDGSFMDYMVKMKEAGRQQVNIDTGVKLPSGFRWKDPANQDIGVEPIPGGPGEQMPSELAARIGLAQDAITRLDAVEQAAGAGDMTGLVDWGLGKAGIGTAGELNRELAAGAEALTRMLTGAGMNMAEAAREANLYLPQPWDTASALSNKVSQLKRRLTATIDMAGRGRGVDPVQAPAAQPMQNPADQSGWRDVAPGVRVRRLE